MTTTTTTPLEARLDAAVDSVEYDILTEACAQIADVDGLTCEIGVRAGGSSYKIMAAMWRAASARPHVAIDPYGNIEYVHHNEEVKKVRLGYSNQMKNRALADLYQWCAETQYHLIFLELEDSEFFRRFADGVPVYDIEKRVVNEYALVFFDGPHSVDTIRRQIDFFKTRTPPNGIWVFDDINQYPHMEKLDAYILGLGFEKLREGKCKASYRRA